MKKEIQIFNNIKMEVENIDSENFLYEVSGIANKYNKSFYDFERTKTLKVYLKNSARIYSLKETEMINKIGHQIKVHHSVMIKFLSWVDPSFEVLANKIVYEHLTNGCKIQKQQLDFKDNEIKSLKDNLKNAKRKVYAYERKGSYQTITRILKDLDCGLTAEVMHNKLKNLNIIGEYEKTVSFYEPLNNIARVDNNILVYHTDSIIDIVSEMGITIKETDPRLF